jgi:hypothetical protein
MNLPARTIRFAMGVALLAAAGGLWWQSERALRRAETLLAAADGRHAHLSGELERTENLLTEKKNTGLKLRRELEKPTATRAPVLPSAVKVTPAPTSPELMARDPQLRGLYLDWQKATQTQEYFPLFQQLGLTPPQQEKFIANLLAVEERRLDAAARMGSREFSSPGVANDLQQLANDQIAAEQLELLGSEGYQRYQDFVRTLPLRNVVVLSVAGAAALEGIPLTPQQGEQLFHTVLNTTRPDPATGAPDLATVDWEVVDTQAALFLSSAQLGLLKTMAPNSGFPSRADLQLKAAMARALDQDREAAAATGSPP